MAPNEIIPLVVILACIGIWAVILGRFLYSRFGPIKTAKGQVVDKFKEDAFRRIYGPAKPAQYYVVFDISGRRKAFQVSEFSYRGYRIGESGTVKYRGRRLISFQ